MIYIYKEYEQMSDYYTTDKDKLIDIWVDERCWCLGDLPVGYEIISEDKDGIILKVWYVMFAYHNEKDFDLDTIVNEWDLDTNEMYFAKIKEI